MLLNGRVVFPPEYELSTIMVLGVIPMMVTPQSLWMNFHVFANTNGEINVGNFNGYIISCLIGNQLEYKVIRLNKIT